MAADIDLVPGSTLGRYVLLEEEQANGSSRSFLAYDPVLERRVQLRVLTVDRAHTSPSVLRAQTLSKLSHTHVAQIFDVGAAGKDLVFVACEIARGQPADVWVAERRRHGAELLEVFRAATSGLAAIHGAGLVHGNIHPDNIVVGDDHCVLTACDLGDSAQETDDFAAPEVQDGQVPDRASDQFALCACFDSLLSATAARSRGPVLTRLRSVVDRGMRRDPDERHGSVDDLLAALAFDPGARRRRIGAIAAVVAVGIGITVGVRGWMAKRAQLCQGSAAHLEAIWNPERAATLREQFLTGGVPYAEDTWKRVVVHLDEYRAAWVAQHTDACRETAVHHRQTATDMDLRMACLHRARVQLEASVRVLAQADETVVERAVQMVGNLPSIDDCADVVALAAELAHPSDPETARRVDEVRSELATVIAWLDAGKYAEAGRAIEPILGRAETIPYPPLLARARLVAGRVALELREDDRAVDLLQTAFLDGVECRDWRVAAMAITSWAIVVSMHQAELAEGQSLAETAASFANGYDPGGVLEASAARIHGATLGLANDNEGALSVLREALQIAQTGRAVSAARAGLLEARIRSSLANVFDDMGDAERAAQENRRVLEITTRVLGPEHPRAAPAIDNLAVNLIKLGHYEESVRYSQQALKIKAQSRGEDHPSVAISCNNLGVAYWYLHRYQDAEQAYRRALEIRLARLGPDHPEVAVTRNNLGGLYEIMGQLDRAERTFREVLSIRLRRYGATHPAVAMARSNLGNVLIELGQTHEGMAEMWQSVSISGRALGATHPFTARMQSVLAKVLIKQKRYRKAQTLLSSATTTWSETLPKGHPDTMDALADLATVYEKLGQPSEVLPLLRRVLDQAEPSSEVRGRVAFRMAKQLDEDDAKARELAMAAKEILSNSDEDQHELVAEITRWLADRK